ncbi:ATP-binding protein [Proteiniphilum sp.]|uniref:sensor histidine kinase n=1 Tax=Proteiniphilum sp. TaxID=1926877 RepID=UPI0033273F88
MEKDGFDKDSFRETLHSLHNKVRNISHALMPPVFKYAAFCDILEDYVSRQKEYFTGNIALNIRHQEIWDSLPAALTLDIYRIVQEGLSNAVKHACAGDISLQFDSNGDTFRFSIEDDGKGFDTTATTRGIGLRTMRERVENLPGEMTLTSETGKGTKISVIFHLADLPHP